MKTTKIRERIYDFIEMYADTPEPKKLCSSIEDLVEELVESKVKNLALSGVSQQRELLPLFDERHLNNGIAFTLTESGKLGSHPESKLVYETTQKLKKWLLDEFELKKR